MPRALRGVALAALAAALTGGVSSAQGTSPTVSITAQALTLATWSADTDNLQLVRGRVTVGGRPAAGVRLRVDGYALHSPTDARGGFAALVDATRIGRHQVTVMGATGTGFSPVAERALAAARGSIDVAYRIRGLRQGRTNTGQPTIEGTLANRDGMAPPTVVLYSYELVGRLVDAHGKPVVGGRVSTRTVDRDYWTVSSPTTADGSFRSLFTASSEQGGDPVPITLRISVGDLVYSYLPAEYVEFARLKSARIDISLPPAGYPIALPVPHSYPGAIYEGIVVGAAADGQVVRPVRTTWPDASGRFTMVLPRRLAGRTISLWEDDLQLFSVATPHAGGPLDLRDWPTRVPNSAPRNIASVRLK